MCPKISSGRRQLIRNTFFWAFPLALERDVLWRSSSRDGGWATTILQPVLHQPLQRQDSLLHGLYRHIPVLPQQCRAATTQLREPPCLGIAFTLSSPIQNHAIIKAGKDHVPTINPTSPSNSPLNCLLKCHIHTVFEHFQGW